MPKTVLFLPGLLCDAGLWRAQVAALSATHDCVVADLTRDDGIDAMAARAIEGLPERFAVCGLSMGGYVALALMRLAPHRVDRLCLMDTSARPDTEAQARRRRGLMAMTRGNRFRGVTPRLLPSLVHPDRLAEPALGAEVMAMAERVGREAFLRQQTAILGRPDSRPFLPAIACPTLVASGEADQLLPLDHATEMREAIPGARLAVLPGCGHLPPLEDPDATTLLLCGWLNGGDL
jgi:pimeloyl-ACP methyl ester carboxylesterase